MMKFDEFTFAVFDAIAVVRINACMLQHFLLTPSASCLVLVNENTVQLTVSSSSCQVYVALPMVSGILLNVSPLLPAATIVVVCTNIMVITRYFPVNMLYYELN